MASNYDDTDGVWRTVGGRRIFIRTGQSLSDAMIQSGKFKNLRSDYRKAKEEETKSKLKQDISSNEAIDEIMNADTGDWNNMNQAERDKTCEKILNDFEDKYGDKLKDKKFREKVLDGLEDQNFHTMGKIIEQKYEYSDNQELSDLDNRIAQATREEEIKAKQEAVNKSFEENQRKLLEANKSPGQKTADLIKENNIKTFGDEIEDNKRLEIAKDIAKEVYGLNEYNASPERIEREARKILEPGDGEVLEKGDTPYTNSKGQLERSTKYLEEWRDSLKKDTNSKKETFISQSTNPFYDDTTYSKEQLDKMAENKIKPMKNTYSGRGWEGINYDSNLSTKDIAKNISDYSKKEFPDVKLSRRTDYNSMDINIMSSDKDLYVSTSDIDKMSDKQISDTIIDSVGGYTRLDDWLNKNNRKSDNGTFTTKDERDYLKEELNTYKSRNGNRAVGDEWYLSEYGKKVVSGLNKEMNSYNFDDDDPMTDYFHSNFYGYVNIGKWDKPYEVSTKTATMNDKIRNSAYKKYMKEHPNSNMTLNEFLKK